MVRKLLQSLFRLILYTLCVQDQTTEAAKAFLAVADTVDDHLFAIVSDPTISSEYNVEGDKIILFKKVIRINCITYYILFSRR